MRFILMPDVHAGTNNPHTCVSSPLDLSFRHGLSLGPSPSLVCICICVCICRVKFSRVC